MHGFLSDGRAYQQARRRRLSSAREMHSIPLKLSAVADFRERLRNISRTEPKAVVKAALQGRRDSLPRRRVRFDGVLHPRRQGGSLSFQPDRARQNRGQQQRLFQQTQSLLAPRGGDQREESDRRVYSDRRLGRLPYDNPIAELNPGDMFGEMTCMSYYPRSATVRARTDCVMLEMLRNVLDILQRNKTFRAQLERNYRARALDSHLRSVPVFKLAHAGLHRPSA